MKREEHFSCWQTHSTLCACIIFTDINIFNEDGAPNYNTDMDELEAQGYIRVWIKHHLIKIDMIKLYRF